MDVRCRRVGHKGADLIAPGNTAASFDAALAAGVDMIEFDVLPEDHRAPGTSRLLLAHDYGHPVDAAPTLEEGLDHLRGETFGEVDLQVDLKLPGYEDRVAAALRERGLTSRALVSTMYGRSLRRLREVDPELRIAWSVPRVRRDYTQSTLLKVPAAIFILGMRALLPPMAAWNVRRGRIDAVMAHFYLVTPRLVRALRRAGGDLYVWTVDDADRIAHFERMGVTGVITNDPRLFAPA
jgi:glycerophosphoryl diester phosphodiesterase